MLFWKSSTDPAAISSGLPLKVAMVTSFPVDWTHPRGGVEAVSVNLVRGLARFQDLEIHVVTTDRTFKNPVRATWEGAVIHRLPWSEKKVLMHAVGNGRREVQDYINKLSPDVIHAHDFYGIMVKMIGTP